jgi:hypothetical protein
MTETRKLDPEAVCAKAGYHHGGLREALITAAYCSLSKSGALKTSHLPTRAASLAYRQRLPTDTSVTAMSLWRK